MKLLHVATSRPVGERCIRWAKSQGYRLVPMDQCDVFVSVMYDRLIHKDFIEKRPCFNFHPGVLPEYRGSGAYSWAIINKERETGVTLHEIAEDIDNGRIIEVRRFPVTEHDTAGSLFAQAEKVMELMFRHWLPRLCEGVYEASPQNDAYATTYFRRELQQAKDLTRFVRAFTFPGKESAYFINSRGERVHIDFE